MSKKMFLNRAIAAAVSEEMARDENVVLIGEDIINQGGGLSIYLGVHDKFPDRAIDMPIAEAGYAYFGVGAAVAGDRPIIDLMFSDFSSFCADAIINGAAKIAFCTQGRVKCPAVFMLANGGRGTYGNISSGCHHSQCVESWFQNIPGLKLVAPYYPADVKGLLKASIRDDDPVLFLFHEGSVGVTGEVPDGEYVIPLTNAAKVMTEGPDITIVAIQSMVPVALEAVKDLETVGIQAELIDPRVLIPLDKETIVKSVQKTKKLLVVQEAPKRGSFSGEIIAAVLEELNGKTVLVDRVGSLNCPLGNGVAEYYVVPKKENIIHAAKQLCGG